MNLEDFIAKYKGKFVEYHSYGTGAKNQCVDLANQYIVEVLKLTAIIGTNANDFPSKANPNDYDYIPNSPLAIPKVGDLIIWNGTWGHIAIFYEGDVNSFVSFDQNYPTGSPCKLVGHSYQGVLGWLHPKKEIMSDTIQIEKRVFEELVGKATKYDEFVNKGFSDVNQVTKLCQQLQKDKESEQKAKNEAQNALALVNNEKTTLQLDVNNLEDEIEALRSDLVSATSEKNAINNDLVACKAKLDQPTNLEEPILTLIADWIKKILKKL